MAVSKQPVLTVVVAIVSDTIRRGFDPGPLEGCLSALSEQANPPAIEILVPYISGMAGIDKVRARFPEVTFIPVSDLKEYKPDKPGREHHDELRARGLAVARGEIVALVEDVARPDPHWCASIVKAHERKFAAVGGAIENAVDRPLNWAVYFCDFGRYQNPVAPGETAMISDANASYKKAPLDEVRTSWQSQFNQVEVNDAIRAHGGKLAIFPEIVVHQHRDGLKLIEALAERFVWGRSFAASRCRWMSGSSRIIRVCLAPVLPVILLTRIALGVVTKRRSQGAFFKALPFIALLTLCWSAGECAGYVMGSK